MGIVWNGKGVDRLGCSLDSTLLAFVRDLVGAVLRGR